MSPFQSRGRLLAGLGALLASGCLSAPSAEARAHRSIIVDIAPLQPLEGSPPRAASDRSRQSAEHGPDTKAGVEKALADPSPATAATGDTRRIDHASAEVSLDGQNVVEPGGTGSIVLAPSARTHWIPASTPSEVVVERIGLGFDVKQDPALAEMRPSILDPTAGAKDLPLTAPSESSQRIAGEREASPVVGASPGDSLAEPGATAASAPYAVAPHGEARGSKRSPALSAFANDVQLISTVVPAMQPPKSASGEGDAALSIVSKAWERSGASLQLPTAWLSQPSAEPAAASAAALGRKPGESSAEMEDRSAQKAEPERKSQFWRRLVQTQAADKPEEAAGQSKLLRAFRQLFGGTPETPAEQAYAALLQEGVRGPTQLRIGDRATLSLPYGYVFLDAEKARDLLDGDEGALDEGNFGVILPSTRSPTWMAYVDLIEQGNIKEDDAKALSPARLLPALATATVAQNVERGRNGLAPLTVSDWIATPKYLPARHSLSSCLSVIDGAALDPQARLVNCASLWLGRRGAIEILVAGALPNLVSFEREAVALGEKLTYDPDAAYERYLPGVDDDAGYGLVSLAGGIVGLKSIAASVAAAGAGKAQDLLLYRIVDYWEALLTALIAPALGIYWFLRN